MTSSSYLELLDWRRRVAELFANVRDKPPSNETLQWFRAEKDKLFTGHPQSPIPAAERRSFKGLPYWPYDPALRVDGHFLPIESGQRFAGEVPFVEIGQLEFAISGQTLHLGAFWIEGYAGGLFVPFRDATGGSETYGGGRYLLDTIKSADLGSDATKSTVVVDFNYAYHPSCAYDPQWVCPLAPPQNRLAVPIRAGERL